MDTARAYELLDLPNTASEDEVKRAYRIKAKQLHPDLNSDTKDIAEEDFKQLTTAYKTILDSRANTGPKVNEGRPDTNNQNRRRAEPTRGPPSLFDIIEEMMQNFRPTFFENTGRRQGRSRRGRSNSRRGQNNSRSTRRRDHHHDSHTICLKCN